MASWGLNKKKKKRRSQQPLSSPPYKKVNPPRSPHYLGKFFYTLLLQFFNLPDSFMLACWRSGWVGVWLDMRNTEFYSTNNTYRRVGLIKCFAFPKKKPWLNYAPKNRIQVWHLFFSLFISKTSIPVQPWDHNHLYNNHQMITPWKPEFLFFFSGIFLCSGTS